MIEEKISELLKETVGRRKKIFRSSLKDLKGKNIALEAKDSTYSAALIRAIMRRAQDLKQAASEYARILRPHSPALIVSWTGPSFSPLHLVRAIADSFEADLESLVIIKSQGQRTLVAIKAKKK